MLIFLKLGGSLLTDKHRPRTPRADVLARLMAEVAEAVAARPGLRLVLGHGSGSFGHVEARRHATRDGVSTPEGWRGFAEVQAAAALLNRLVIDAARQAGLAVLNLPPSASAVCRDGALRSLAVEPLRAALEHGLVPVVFGDVAVDESIGGTIVSTEDVFRLLAPRLRPQRILLAGRDPGVLTRWPDGDVISVITADAALEAVGGSQAADVTGGMAGKVRQMQALAAEAPGIEIRIFSGETPGLLKQVLLGLASPGTVVGVRPGRP
jgi:isopentenyl phosphate kinase